MLQYVLMSKAARFPEYIQREEKHSKRQTKKISSQIRRPGLGLKDCDWEIQRRSRMFRKPRTVPRHYGGSESWKLESRRESLPNSMCILW